MPKTKPIGVRFDEDLLLSLKNSGIATSPQKALNLYENSYARGMKTKTGKEDVLEKVFEAPLIAEEGNGNKEGIFALETEIVLIRAEKVPAHRNTVLGNRSWQIEQNNRIKELQEKINTLKQTENK